MYDYLGDETNNNYYTNQSLNFTNWRNGEPGSRNRLCTAYLLKTLLWGDDLCTALYSVIYMRNK